MKKWFPPRKLISLITALTLILSLFLTMLPPVNGSDSVKTVWLNPSAASPFHNGEFQGWGTSLCWWANRVGYSPSLTQQAVKAFFSEEGLGLDIARYNIGGGENPDHNHVLRSDSMVPGMWESYEWYNYNEAGGYHNDVRLTYDITNDQNQLNVAKAALAENPELYFEGFSNSAPYFMTYSWCTSGATNAWSNNLREEMYDDFARYIADCTKLLAEEGIRFQSYSPINEPTQGWGENNPDTSYLKQEGCHFSSGESESKIIVETRKALDAAGLSDVLVASMDESSIDQSVANLDQLTAEAKTALGRIDTHTYGGSQRYDLKEKAINLGKTLWMSEVDGDFKTGTGAMEGALGLAERIILDMNQLQPAAWVMWNVIDVHRDSSYVNPKGERSESGDYWYDSYGDPCFSWYYPNSGFWGISLADHDTQELKLSQKYYGYGQFTRYIEPGDTIIASSDSTLAAYNKTSGDIKIVAINTAGSDQPYRFDLSAFTNVGTEVEMIRTSGSLSNGEHWATISGGASMDGKILSTTLKANSITTYVVKGRGSVSVIRPGSDLCGVYSIRSAVNGSYALDVSEASQADGANVHLWSAGTDRNQLFRILPDGEGYYTIEALHSGKCLDVSAWGTADGTNIHQYAKSGDDNQKWRVVQNDDGTCTFISKHSNKALDLSDGKAVNGQNIQIWSAHYGSAQKWTLMPYLGITEGVYKLKLQGTSYALNVSGNAMSAGANVQLWDGSNDDGNLWRIAATADGYYTLQAVHSNRYLNASGYGTADGTNVIQWNSDTAQINEKWAAVPNGDGSWSFLSACSGLMLDVADGTAANGTNVRLWTGNGSAAQRWTLTAGNPHAHTYQITTQNPTCTQQGFTAYTCTECGVVYRENVTAILPHTPVTDAAVAATCTEAGLTAGSHCSACGEIFVEQEVVPATGHKYENGVCTTCGEAEPVTGPVYDANLIFRYNSFTMGSALNVVYIVGAGTTNYADVRAVVTKYNADGTTTEKTYSIADGTMKDSGSISTFTFDGVAAKELGDTFVAKLYATGKDGTEYYGEEKTLNLKDLLLPYTQGADSAKKDLAVALLNYGAAAQVYFNYGYDAADPTTLVNNDLTAEQKVIDIREASATASVTGDGAKNVYNTVLLESKIVLYAIFNLSDYSSRIGELTAVVTNAETGEVVTTLPVKAMGTNGSFRFDDVSAKNTRTMFSIAIYDGETKVSQDLQWSVECMVSGCRADANTSQAKLNLANAILAYGDYAAAYLG